MILLLLFWGPHFGNHWSRTYQLGWFISAPCVVSLILQEVPGFQRAAEKGKPQCADASQALYICSCTIAQSKSHTQALDEEGDSLQVRAKESLNKLEWLPQQTTTLHTKICYRTETHLWNKINAKHKRALKHMEIAQCTMDGRIIDDTPFLSLSFDLCLQSKTFWVHLLRAYNSNLFHMTSPIRNCCCQVNWWIVLCLKS